MKQKLLGGTIIVALLAAGIANYYGFGQRETREPIVSVEKITLGAELGLLNAAIWVAEHKGYFRDEGLEVTTKEFQAGRQALLAMLKGEPLDIVTVAPTPIMLNSFDRQDFAILATFVESQADDTVIGRKDRGIVSIADLKGKKVGVPTGTSAQFVLELVLVEGGILPSQVDVVDIKPLELPNALASGQVDAIAIWQPHAYRVSELLPAQTVELARPGTHRTTFNLVAMKEVVISRQGAIRKFLRALDRANLFIDQNRDEAQSIVAAKLKLDAATVAKLFPKFSYRLFLDQPLLFDLESQARWAMKSQLTEKTAPPNFLRLISTDALKTVKPQAVSVIESSDQNLKSKP